VPGERVQGSGFGVQTTSQEAGVGGQQTAQSARSSTTAAPVVAAVFEMPVARAATASPAPVGPELRAVKPKSRPRPPQLPLAQVEVPVEMEAVPPLEATRIEIPPAPPAPSLPLPVESAPPAPIVIAEPVVPAVDVADAIAPATHLLTIAELDAPPPVATDVVAPLTTEHVGPEPQPDPQLIAAPRAITPDRHWLPAAYGLAASLAAAALFGITPAVWDVVDYARSYELVDSPHVARWALIVFLLGLVQVAYAAFLFQLPDWTSVWVVTLYSLAQAGLYALMLGLVLISGTDGLLVGPRGLELTDKLAGGQAALWCLAMTCLSIILAFFAGRLSGQWRRAESMLSRHV
jgi:hypothetical protein